jgi:hypothetical protein
MLIDLKTKNPIRYVPHPETAVLLQRLSVQQLAAAISDIHRRIEYCVSTNTHCLTTSWEPGSDWTDTPFEPLWSVAAQRNCELAAKVFGLLCWIVFMEHGLAWSFGHYEKDGIPIRGLTYFQVKV